jgi:ribonuclease D
MALSVNYTLIKEDSQLPGLLADIERADVIGFDTEFVAEDCYRPDLCLIQISTRAEVFIVDPKTISELKPLWDALVSPTHTILVHAGREEILFAYRATGSTFPKLFDVQIALGLLGGEFPASYGKLLQRQLGQSLSKGETRTDWRKRPLSSAQLEYAALDVLHLPVLYDSLKEQLVAAGRNAWLDDEVARRQSNLICAQLREGWPRIGGVQSMHGRQLGVVRELWLWRERRAEQRNMPARRVLRDDLIVELARRGSAMFAACIFQDFKSTFPKLPPPSSVVWPGRSRKHPGLER